MKKIHSAGEDYLEAILVMQQQQGNVRSIELARHMGYSRPSISHAVGQLREGGFVTVDGEGYLHLTESGLAIARKMYDRRQFFLKLLAAVGVDSQTAEEDACRMEHVVSDESFQKLQILHDRALQMALYQA